MPLAIEFTNAGFKVVGIDIDERKVKSINKGKNYIKDVDNDLFDDKKYSVSMDDEVLNKLKNFMDKK